MLPMDGDARTEGNQEVIRMLEHWLTQAKQGKITYVGMVGAEGLTRVNYGTAGAIGAEWAINWGLDCLKRKIYDMVQGRNAPTDPNITADYACFNLMQMAPSFDFMNWLAIAEITRRREGAPAPLKVGFWQGVTGNTWKDDDRRPGMLENVVRPAMKFIGAIEDPKAVHGRLYHTFLLRYVSEALAYGQECPEFRATSDGAISVAAMLAHSRRPVVITLREAKHWPHRNSNLAEWIKFADYLTARGETVIFVRDTAKADEKIAGYQTCPRASRDLDFRLALYEQAKCSMFAANGPWNLAVFGRFPWLMVNEALENDPFEYNTPEGWQKHCGLTVGEQFSWSLPTQRIIWKKDTFDNMRAAWDEFAPILETRAAA